MSGDAVSFELIAKLGTDPILDRKQRFELFLKRLAATSAAATHDEAFQLLADTLDEIEDAYSGVPNEPADYRNDGRLYPPQRDSRRTVPGRDGLTRYRSRRHNVWIGANGAIRIDNIPPAGRQPHACLSKAGADGRSVEFDDG